MPATTVRGKTVRIQDWADKSDIIDSRRFEDCDIQGPAVLVVVEAIEIRDSHLGGLPSQILWTIEASRERVVGAIGVRNCLFIRCQFQNIGFAGTPDVVAQFVDDAAAQILAGVDLPTDVPAEVKENTLGPTVWGVKGYRVRHPQRRGMRGLWNRIAGRQEDDRG